ncbi:MAG TPA: hypothetical protein VMS22_14165 [Candidatus Eisenbacteria bacterium]|nr:hypothetical protein [Candidatus Eisenbacteria bacterium]
MSTGAGYEERDVSFRPVVAAAFALLAVIVGTFVLMWVLNRGLVARETEESPPASPLAASYGRQEPPAPRLQDNPRRDLAELRARDQKLLDTYGWIDRDEGRVRIPVARAMELMLAEGKP